MSGNVATRDSKASLCLSAVRAAFDDLLNDTFDGWSAADLVELADLWEVQQRRSLAITHALVAALGTSGAPGEFGYRDTAALLADLLRLTPGAARARTRAADDLGPRRSLLGEALPPQFEHVAHAQRSGVISAEHAKVIITALDALSPEADVRHSAEVQATLVEHAEQLDPKRLGSAATRLLAHLDPDGQRPSEAEQQRRRDLTFGSTPDNSGHLEGHLTPELLAALHAVLDPLSAPLPAEDGTTDPRTAGQRRHDGLLDLCHRALRWGDIPASGGVPATLILTMPEADFRQQQGFATTVHGDLLPANVVRRLVDQADIFSLVLNHNGGILDYGRDRRLATAGQRCAIYGRDVGCTMPGCTVPGAWCQVHHVIEWISGGRTAVENMTLVCGHHHRTFEQLGWRVVMRNGVPWWIPPEHLDQQQRPRQNHYWRRPKLG